jgi:pimeloyl-ACP methyl ester carboxylesterase
MIDHDSYRVLLGRIRMHVRDWQGAGPPVVFVHSFTANSLLALRLGSLLSPRRRLIAPDLRGRGMSDAPAGECGIALHAQSVIECLDRLQLDRFVIAGHSFGAAISLLLAAQHPHRVTGLILFDGGAPPAPEAARLLDAYYGSLRYRYPTAEAYIERFKASPLYQPWTEELDILTRSNLYQQPDGTYIRQVARYVVDAERRAESEAFWAQLPELYAQVRCPVLIVRAGYGITGKDDQVLPDATLAAMLAAMPSARAVTVEEAGHTSLMTIPHGGRDAAICAFLGI